MRPAQAIPTCLALTAILAAACGAEPAPENDGPAGEAPGAAEVGTEPAAAEDGGAGREAGSELAISADPPPTLSDAASGVVA